MADEVEIYLVNKLNKVLPEIQSSVEKNSFINFGIVDKKITKLKSLLEPNSPMAARVPNRKELLYDLNNILNDYQIRRKSRSLSKNLERILANHESGSGRQQTAGNADSNEGASQLASHQESSAGVAEDHRWSTRTVDPAKVYGFEDKVTALQRKLVSQNADDSRFRAIGIVGMRGVGKTTFSQLIFCNEEVKNHFLPRIWVCVSKQPQEDEDKRKEIVKRMLTCLGVEEDVIKSIDQGTDDGLKRLLFALRLQLMGKRYLIILDDLWNTEDEMKDFCLDIAEELKCDEKLAYGLPKGRGGAVIVTSRAEEVVKGMVGEGNLKVLEPLKDKDSIWKIFEEAAEENGKKLTKELDSLKERIVDKCAGLPLAAKMMGEIANKQIITANEQTRPNPPVENSSQYAQGPGTPPTPANQGFEEEVGTKEQEKKMSEIEERRTN
ncbi:hypothetical protein NMG60_11012587 [Bertholletia excelsa]